ncbi:endonuclease MutS2 [Chloroflexota bacterium]
MDDKTLHTLEFDKVLARLEEFTAFSASAERVQGLRPSDNHHTARRSLAEVSEARLLLDLKPETTIGGARDIRELADGAARGKVLTPSDLLAVKATLISARNLSRMFEKEIEQFPYLWEISQRLPAPMGLVDAITRAISERGELHDNASPELGRIRSELRITHDRLLERMQGMLSNRNIAPYLQEALVTQRDGRYVLPLKADAKGRVKAVVHDVSSSGATLFIEPLQVVDLNNQWRELQVAEREEERRILAELSDQIGDHQYELISAVETIAELDFTFARAKYAEAIKATEPTLKKFAPKKGKTNPGMTLILYQARHPLLDQDTVVPVDLELDPSTYVMIITGPNTGGKTVTLKTVGLLSLMAQAGLHIPAQSGSEISLFKTIFADIGDEQSIEQSLSTFSGHITNIIKILDQADKQSLVIIDELGAGTDPQEGAALAQAILTFLVDGGIPTLVATHYPELKTYAHSTEGVVNASVEFDLESLRPTYHLTIGLPGRSNALAIARRLGLQEEIVTRARSTIDPAELKAEDLLDEIHRQRDLTRKARQAAESAQSQVERLRDQLTERLESVEDERLEVINQARLEAQQQVDDLQEEVAKVRRQLALARQPLEVVQQAEEQASELEDTVEAPVERRRVAAPEVPIAVPSRPIRLGDKVRLTTLGKDGIVSALSEDEAEVMIGNLRVRVELYDLELVGGQAQEKKPKEDAAPAGAFKIDSPGVELSLRGQAVDEALDSLENYIDRAYAAGLPYVRIVHGKGTGKLRDAVRQELRSHSLVSRFEPGGPSEGGDGVTVAFFKGA